MPETTSVMPGANWAGNVTYRARELHTPRSVPELQDLVSQSRRIRALGTRHSFSTVADTDGDLVSLAALPKAVEIDATAQTVTVSAGMRYGEVGARLQAEGWALHNLGSLPHISVAGACSTGTHGSGNAKRNLATAVRALEVVTANGELRWIDDMRGAVLSLGALGVFTRLVLAVEPTYDLTQSVFEDLSFTTLTSRLAEIFAAGDSVSVFTDWQGATSVWVKTRGEIPEIPGTRPADGPRHPLAGVSPEHCTEQLGRPGPWNERLPHFRLEFTPSSGEEVQTEYFVPVEAAAGAVEAMHSLGDEIAPHLLVSEIRTVAADDLWLSPSYGRDSVALHFTWKPELAPLPHLLGLIEERLAAFAVRPHWGKVFTMAPEAVMASYEHSADFAALRRDLDPENVFGNEYVDRLLASV